MLLYLSSIPFARLFILALGAPQVISISFIHSPVLSWSQFLHVGEATHPQIAVFRKGAFCILVIMPASHRYCSSFHSVNSSTEGGDGVPLWSGCFLRFRIKHCNFSTWIEYHVLVIHTELAWMVQLHFIVEPLLSCLSLEEKIFKVQVDVLYASGE